MMIRFFVWQLLLALDQLVNVLFGGYADETMSSRAYRMSKRHDAGLFGWRWRERGSNSKWFCSEAIADCLGYRDAWRFDPNTLFVVLRRANDFNNKKVGE